MERGFLGCSGFLWHTSVVIVPGPDHPEGQEEEDDAEEQDDEAKACDEAIHPTELFVGEAPDGDLQRVVEPAAERESGAAREDEEDAAEEQKLLDPRRLRFLLGGRLGLEELFREDLAAPRALLRLGLDLRAAAGALGDLFHLGGDRPHQPSPRTPPLLTLSSSVSGKTPGDPRNPAPNSRANPFILGARVVK